MLRKSIFFTISTILAACSQHSPLPTPTKFTNEQLENERKLREKDLAKAKSTEVNQEKSIKANYDIFLKKFDISNNGSGSIIDKSKFKSTEVDFDWEPSPNAFNFKLFNNSGKTIKIIWDSVVFIDSSGESHKVIHSGVKLIDRNSSQPPTIVAKGSHIFDSIQPADNIRWINGYSTIPGKWDEKSILPVSIYGGNSLRNTFKEIVSSQIGKKLKILVTLDFSGMQKEYLFEFDVRGAATSEDGF